MIEQVSQFNKFWKVTLQSHCFVTLLTKYPTSQVPQVRLSGQDVQCGINDEHSVQVLFVTTPEIRVYVIKDVGLHVEHM